MAGALRVLVVDDSALMRQMLSRFLTGAGMEVVATARDGVDGLEKALSLKPDVITLDVEMPRMNGLDMLRRLMEEAPMPVVMVSSVTQQQTPAAVEALMLGAVDIVAKPGGAISLNLGDVEAELVAKVRAAAYATVRPRRPGATRGTAGGTTIAPAPTTVPRPRTSSASGAAGTKPRTSVASGAAETMASSTDRLGPGPVVVGSSTGGPGALSTILSALSGDFPRPIVVVQHMPPGFTASLARRLDTLSSLIVAEAVEHRRALPGEAWIAPGGVHLVFDGDGHMRYSRAAPHLGVRPAVDLTLESAVDVWGGDVIAVILTGMGIDGARGARQLKRVGGTVLAQDEHTSVVYGMPRAVAEMGLVDVVRPLSTMAASLTDLAVVRH